jgi:hypothetical protein
MEFSRVGQDGHVDGEMIFNLFTVTVSAHGTWY